MYRNRKSFKLIAVGLLLAVLVVGLGGCSSWRRGWKSTVSDFSGGINRTVTVYDYNGNAIDSWSGKFDISESQNEIFFDDQNDKRVIIHGGIVIVEEN